MSTLTQIKAALPKLSEAELKQLAADLDRLFVVDPKNWTVFGVHYKYQAGN